MQEVIARPSSGQAQFPKHLVHYPANTESYLDAVFALLNTVGVPSTCQPLPVSEVLPRHSSEAYE